MLVCALARAIAWVMCVVFTELGSTHAGDLDAHEPTHESVEETLEPTERRTGLGVIAGLSDAIHSDHDAAHLLFVELGVTEHHLDDQLHVADVLVRVLGLSQ